MPTYYLLEGKKISERQRQVWMLTAQSKTMKQIGGILGISPNTVEWHRGELSKQLNIFDIAGLTRAAIRSGLIKP